MSEPRDKELRLEYVRELELIYGLLEVALPLALGLMEGVRPALQDVRWFWYWIEKVEEDIVEVLIDDERDGSWTLSPQLADRRTTYTELRIKLEEEKEGDARTTV